MSEKKKNTTVRAQMQDFELMQKISDRQRWSMSMVLRVAVHRLARDLGDSMEGTFADELVSLQKGRRGSKR